MVTLTVVGLDLIVAVVVVVIVVVVELAQTHEDESVKCLCCALKVDELAHGRS